jgi:hypothetical protein
VPREALARGAERLHTERGTSRRRSLSKKEREMLHPVSLGDSLFWTDGKEPIMIKAL